MIGTPVNGMWRPLPTLGLWKRNSRILLFIVVIVTLIPLHHCELHRAKSAKTKGLGHENSSHGRYTAVKTGHNSDVWVYSIVSAMLVGLSGIFPLIVIPAAAGESLNSPESSRLLKNLLSFAVGGLLGDVFLHLLPEAWGHCAQGDHQKHLSIGMWVLVGILSFLIVEKFSTLVKEEDAEDIDAKHAVSSHNGDISDREHNETKDVNHEGDMRKRINTRTKNNNSCIKTQNGVQSTNKAQNGSTNVQVQENKSEKIAMSGWLNLLANVIDNFTHGLAVAGSYSLGIRGGMITTAIILLHEIPHELGDFAILLKAGFNRWKAAQAQLLTATGGVIGAIVGLAADSVSEAGDKTAWILPFTSGGFIYISLVTVVPDLLKETNALDSLRQVMIMLSGIFVMAFIAIYLEH